MQFLLIIKEIFMYLKTVIIELHYGSIQIQLLVNWYSIIILYMFSFFYFINYVLRLLAVVVLEIHQLNSTHHGVFMLTQMLLYMLSIEEIIEFNNGLEVTFFTLFLLIIYLLY